MKIIIVGFRVAEENSTFYRKIEMLNDKDSDHKLMKAFRLAISKSDFVSVRINRGDKDITGG